MNQIIKLYFRVLIFAPFLAFLILGKLNLVPYYFFGSIGSILVIFLLFQRQNIKIPKFVYPILVLASYYLLWEAYNGRIEKMGIIKILFKNVSLHTASVIILISNTRFTIKDYTRYITAFKLIIVLSVIFTLIQIFIDTGFYVPEIYKYFNENTPEYDIRNVSIWGYLDLMDVGLSFIPFLIIVINNEIDNKSKWIWLWLLMGSLVCILTNSRWTMVNLLIVYIFMGLRFRKKYKGKNALVFIRIFIIIGIVSLGTFYFLSNYVYNISEYAEKRIQSNTAETRLLGSHLFLKYFPEKMWFGHGVRVNEELAKDLEGKSSQIHIGYLSHLYEFGIIGTIFFFSFIFLILKYFIRAGKYYDNYVGLSGFLCFFLANFTLVAYSIFHVGIFFLFIHSCYRRQNYESAINFPAQR